MPVLSDARKSISFVLSMLEKNTGITFTYRPTFTLREGPEQFLCGKCIADAPQ